MCSYKIDERKRKMMENLDRCYKVVQQSRTGITAIEVSKKLNVHRTTAHSYLNTLDLMGKVYSEKGLWHAKEGKVEEETPKESDTDKAKAVVIMKTITVLYGKNALTKEDWDYFIQDDGKSKLDKARALMIIKSAKATLT